MSWSTTFRDVLRSRTARYSFAVRTYATAHFPRASYLAGSDLQLGVAVSDTNLTADGFSISGESLSLPDVSATHGSATLRFASVNPTRIINGLPKGALVEMLVAPLGDGIGKAEPIGIGVVDDISTGGSSQSTYSSDGSAVGALWEVAIQGLGALLGSRHTDDGTSSLFSDMFDTTTTVSGTNYVAGDTTLYVASTAPWADWDTEGIYWVRVTPTTGDPFILRATGRTATSFTGVSATGQLGTTAGNASTGQLVEVVAAIEGHPVDVALKVLTSTGAGTNGSSDTLPESAGFAIPVDLIDTAYCARVKTRNTPTSGNLTIVAYSLEEQENPGDWLADFLAGTGFFITIRQGKIIVMDVQEPHTAATEFDLYDDNIATWDEVRLYDATQGPQAKAHVITYTTGEKIATGTINTVPSVNRVELACPGFFGSDSNIAAKLTQVSDRLLPYATRVRSLITVTLVSAWWSQFCPGTVGTLTSEVIRLRPDGSGSTRVNARRVVVQQVNLLPEGGTVMQLLVIPSS